MFQKDKQSQQNPSQPNEEEDKEYLPSYTKLLGLAKRERGMLSFAVILMILSKATNVVNPIILASAYDSLVNPTLTSSEKMDEINVVMIAVVVVHFSGVLLEFIQGSIMAVASERVVARLRNNLYGAILQQEIAFFDEHQTGELVSRLGSDTTLVQQAASNALPQVFVGFVEIVAAIVVMFVISPELAGVTVGFVVVVCILSLPFGAALGRLSKAYQDALGEAQTHSTEALGGIRTVQAFAAEDREKQRYQHKIGDPDSSPWWWPKQHKVNKTTYSVGFFSSITGAALESIVYGIGFGSMFISLWYGFKLVNDGDLSLGKLTAFQTYIFEIGAELGQISAFIAQLIEARGASGRIFQLLEREPKIPSKREGPHDDKKPDNGDKQAVGDIESGIDASGVATPPPTTMGGSIVFSNVEFAYPTRPDITVLRDFSLSIPPNSTAALVGSSGSGKSTVVGLLQRFYDVAKGSIHIDGQDIRDVNLQWLRSNMGYVQQEPQLFGLTVRENICYGVDRTVSQAEIEHACQEANAHDFIMEWPDKYETLVGERGVQLSGGQKQRIAIARALLINPRILLLDEATSALDAESEHLVQEAIDKAMVGRTVVIVAHRLSTITTTDQIVVIDNHQIANVGTHHELMGTCEKYQDLIKRQSIVGIAPPV